MKEELGELCGIKVCVNSNDFEELKKQKLIEENEILKDLQQRIDKAIEYIHKRYYWVLGDETFLDHDDLVDRRIALYLLNILEGKDE